MTMATIRTLVIDDDISMLAYVRAALSAHGHTVFCSSDGDHAVKIAQRHSVHLVITDMLMPNTDGLGVVTRLRELLPQVAVVVMSGGSDIIPKDYSLSLARLGGARRTLTKPFRVPELLTAVNQALEEANREAQIDAAALSAEA
jgi:DNA-binding NtrC family response regulator